MASPSTRVIDAGGRLVLPGFNDAHVHLVWGAEELVGVNLRPATDERDLAARLAAHAARLPGTAGSSADIGITRRGQGAPFRPATRSIRPHRITRCS